MMAADRDLQLRGYDVYRFGGAELADTPATRRRSQRVLRSPGHALRHLNGARRSAAVALQEPAAM